MDPVTVLAGAKAAFETVKAGIKLGKELHGVATDLAKLFGAHAELTRMAADPPKPGWLSKTSPEQIALDAFVARKEAESMNAQVRNMVVGAYGLSGWDELQRMVIAYRKEQRAARIAAEMRRKQIIEALMLWGSITILAAFVASFLFIMAMIVFR